MTQNEASAQASYFAERVAHWNGVAATPDVRSISRAHYHRRLAQVYRLNVAEGLQVLEVGCGRGDLLAALKPARGVGIDFSEEMVAQARQRHPELEFVVADAHDLDGVPGLFDVIIISDLVNDLWDVQAALQQLRRMCTPSTRIIVNIHSRIWELPLRIATSLGLATKRRQQNWLTLNDLRNLLALSGFEEVRSWQEELFPVPIPLLDGLFNRLLVRLAPFRYFALSNFVLARPVGRGLQAKRPRVSVIVPARNEAGNVAAILDRVPKLGGGTELIFVEGHSSDNTLETIKAEIAKRPGCGAVFYQQTGKGKGDAVRLGFEKATGDILLILDADLTVRPEDLPRFVEVLDAGTGDFVNGVRLVYPMQDEAMRFLNFLGNKFFSWAFSWLLGQPIKDTLCGTKVLWRRDYERIAANRAYFGDFDPFGDFDLLFGAAKMGLKIVEMPIRYHARTYGETNIDRWRHGWMLLKMVVFAARRIKFV